MFVRLEEAHGHAGAGDAGVEVGAAGAKRGLPPDGARGPGRA